MRALPLLIAIMIDTVEDDKHHLKLVRRSAMLQD
jgi:hypothetical protein